MPEIYRIYMRKPEGGAELLYEGTDSNEADKIYDDPQYHNGRLTRTVENTS